MAVPIIYFRSSERYNQPVVGESNYQAHLQTAFDEDGRYIEVSLILEPHNIFDKNAVYVSYGADKLGYLSRENAVLYHAALAKLGHPTAMGVCKAKIIGGRENRSYGIVLDLDIQNPQVERIIGAEKSPPSQHKKQPAKFGGKMPLIPINGKGWLYWLVIFPFVGVVNLYIILFWGIWFAIKWMLDAAGLNKK